MHLILPLALVLLLAPPARAGAPICPTLKVAGGGWVAGCFEASHDSVGHYVNTHFRVGGRARATVTVAYRTAAGLRYYETYGPFPGAGTYMPILEAGGGRRATFHPEQVRVIAATPSGHRAATTVVL